MTELQTSERPAYSSEQGMIDSWSEATDWLTRCSAVAWSALIGHRRRQRPATLQKMSTSNVTDYFPPDDVRGAPTFSGPSPPLAWRGRIVGISVNARMSIGCQRGLTGIHPPFKKIFFITSTLPAAKPLKHVWPSDVNRELFLEMLVRI